MKAHVTGDKKLIKTIGNINRLSEKEIQRETARVGFKVKTAAVKKIQQDPATGKVYGDHRASAPGEPPATDEGALVGSIEMTQKGLDAYVFTNKEYGRYLELGTLHIRPRPWLRPSLNENKDELKDGVKRAVMRGARKAKPKS